MKQIIIYNNYKVTRNNIMTFSLFNFVENVIRNS